MRNSRKYGYKSSCGSNYRRSSYGSYGGYGKRKSSGLKIILIILLCVFVLAGAAAAAAYAGLFGDSFRLGAPAQESSQNITEEKSTSEKSESQSAAPKKEPEGKWEENVFIYDKNGFEPFSASDSTAKDYAGCVNKISKELGSDVNVYCMLAPSHSFTGLPDKYKNIGSDEKKSIEKTYSMLDKNVKSIDVCAALEKHRNEYIYFATDTNWTALGAYYAYRQFCDAADMDAVDIKTLPSGKIEGFRGSLHAATITDEKPGGSEVLDQNPDTVVYYKTEGYCRLLESGESEDREVPMIAEFASGSNAYSAFIWGNNPYMKIETSAGSGRKLCIIKDSFGCAFAPFTAAGFDQVFIADPAYYEGNIIDFIKDNKYTDVLILNSSSTANTAGRVDELKTII